MFESIGVVGERGQITLPKKIRDLEGIKEKDRVVIGLVDGRIVVQKLATPLSKKEKEESIKEYYRKHGKLDERITKEWEHADRETWAMIDDY